MANREAGVRRGKQKGAERHRHLLLDPKVRAWYDERALRSKLSADVYLRQLGGMLDRLELTAEGVVDLSQRDPDALRESLVRYAAALKRAGRLDSYIVKTFDGLRSWLRSRRSKFEEFPKLGSARGVSLENERIPTQEELRRVLDRLTPRGRVIALMMAHSGVRPGVLGAYGAVDGLTLGDLPELQLGKRSAFREVPFVVRVPARLSKTRRAYTTFGTSELSSAILAYLDQRRTQGEQLGVRSPLVTVDSFAATHDFHGKTGSGRFLTTKGVVFELREGLKAGAPKGVTWRPYVLRSYCSTRLLLAESHGRIPRDLREAILGHDGGVASRYNVGKLWGEELLKEARSAYARSAEFLETAASIRPGGRDVETIRFLLEFLGVPAEKVSEIDLSGASPEDLKQLARKYLGREAAPNQRVVSNGEIPKLLTEGWTFVATLAENQAILKPPVGSVA